MQETFGRTTIKWNKKANFCLSVTSTIAQACLFPEKKIMELFGRVGTKP